MSTFRMLVLHIEKGEREDILRQMSITNDPKLNENEVNLGVDLVSNMWIISFKRVFSWQDQQEYW